MIAFSIVAALMVIGALLFLVPPLLGKRKKAADVSHGEANLSIYRDQLKELDGDLANGVIDRLQHDSAKRELERRVIEEVELAADRAAGGSGVKWGWAGVLSFTMPVAAFGTYLALGTPAALDASRTADRQIQRDAHELSPQRLAAMVTQLGERLQAMPEDAEGWLMLARTTGAMARYEDSADACRQVVRLVPNDAQLFADFADTLAMAQGRSLAGEPERLIERALAVDPRNVKALALGGTAAFGRGDYAQASTLWKRVLEIVPPDSEMTQRIQASLAQAADRSNAGLDGDSKRPGRSAGAM